MQDAGRMAHLMRLHNMHMPNIANVFKSEIARLARKQVREDTAALKRAAALHRSELAALKRRVAALEGLAKKLAKADRTVAPTARPRRSAVPAQSGDDSGLRFRAQGLATNRERLGLSAADFGLLVGTTGQSIYAWEAGKSKPRTQALAAIAALRGIGKREVDAKLASLKGQ